MSKYCPYHDSDVVYMSCQECDRKICEPNTFFCLVVGSRSFNDFDRMKITLDYLLSKQASVVIVSGGAKGADTLAERYAHEHGYPLIVYSADWNQYGKSAGYIRNEQMHKFLSKQKKRGCVAFWDGVSRGTQHNFGLAQKYNTPLRVINTKGEHNNGISKKN